jgi:hypothetical protein
MLHMLLIHFVNLLQLRFELAILFEYFLVPHYPIYGFNLFDMNIFFLMLEYLTMKDA